MEMQYIAQSCFSIALAIILVIFGAIFVYGAVHLAGLIQKTVYLVEKNYSREIAKESEHDLSIKSLPPRYMENPYFDPEEHLPAIEVSSKKLPIIDDF